MEDKHHYQSCYRTKDYKRRYKHRYQYLTSHRHDPAGTSDISTHQSKSKSYPLMSNKALPSSTLTTALPQERESWIRSVKKTKINEGTEQKTQYLETMLRMQSWIHSVEQRKSNQNTEQRTQYVETIVRLPPQQQSSMNSSTFDRVRFADQQIPIITRNNNNNLDANSFHLINDINNNNEINAVEKILFDKELSSNTKSCSSQITNDEPILITDSDPSRWSGFLIDNCDEEISSPASPLPHEQRAMLVNELNAADGKQRQASKCQKPLHKKLRKKKKSAKVNNKNQQELSSDWIIEYDTTETDQISELTDMIKKTSTTMTDKDRIANINTILEKIKRQQMELRKLRQHVMSMLHEEPKSNSTNTTQQSTSIDQDLLMKFVNQPITSGCWLCSGKTYTEVAIQCNTVHKQ